MVYGKTRPSTDSTQRWRSQTQSTVRHPQEVAWETEPAWSSFPPHHLPLCLPGPPTLILATVFSVRSKLSLSATSRQALEPQLPTICTKRSRWGHGIMGKCLWSFVLVVAHCGYYHNCSLGEAASLCSSWCCSQFSPSYWAGDSHLIIPTCTHHQRGALEWEHFY